ncbi:MAG: hypothetical protein M3680_03090 [Myxococcota bacterium]|nr:hypothetical protein [Myxococcota bacterium]
MSTAPNAPKALTQAHPQEEFAVEKATYGGVTLVTMHGTLDHAFEGKKVAESIATKKLVVMMRDVRRFASWGMSEWMDFLRINSSRDLYLVECSTYAVSQINLVTGLLGHAKLVSFYASYRCGSCSEELETLFLIPKDRASIRELPGSHQECRACGGRARLEEYPAAFFETIAGRPSFDIDDEVLAFLRSRMKYELSPDLTRFRAHRRVRQGYTYLKVSGSMAMLPPEVLAGASEGTTVLDVHGAVVNPTQLAPWRAYLQAAVAKVPSLQLLNCPPGFLEQAVVPEDLQDKLKVRSFALSYDCPRCTTPTAAMIDVAENLEQLVGGTAPPARCASCQSLLVASLAPAQVALLRALPARNRDVMLDKFLEKARAEPLDKLENCLVATPQKPTKSTAASGRTMYAILGMTTLVVVGLAVVAFTLWKQRDEAKPAVAAVAVPVPVPPAAPAFERPDWIMSDVPSSAYCHDMINRLMCVGVSSYRPARDQGVAEANDAALEELVNAVGLRISDPYFRERVMPAYSEVRSKSLSALQAADLDRTSAAYLAADEVVTRSRKRVVEILQISGGAAVPSQRTDWYWEEYGAKDGSTEVLVFVRYDVTLDAVKALAEKYAATTQVLDSTAMTAFPAVAWQSASFTGGAMLTKVGRPLAKAGVAPMDVITSVSNQRIGDVIGFTRRLEEWQKTATDLELAVVTGDAPARVVTVPRRGR